MSREAQKKLKNVWQKRRSHAGLKLIEEWNGGWRWELHLYLKRDGPARLLSGTPLWTMPSKRTDLSEDQEKDGKTKSTNTRGWKHWKRPEAMTWRTTAHGNYKQKNKDNGRKRKNSSQSAAATNILGLMSSNQKTELSALTHHLQVVCRSSHGARAPRFETQSTIRWAHELRDSRNNQQYDGPHWRARHGANQWDEQGWICWRCGSLRENPDDDTMYETNAVQSEWPQCGESLLVPLPEDDGGSIAPQTAGLGHCALWAQDDAPHRFRRSVYRDRRSRATEQWVPRLSIPHLPWVDCDARYCRHTIPMTSCRCSPEYRWSSFCSRCCRWMFPMICCTAAGGTLRMRSERDSWRGVEGTLWESLRF